MTQIALEIAVVVVVYIIGYKVGYKACINNLLDKFDKRERADKH